MNNTATFQLEDDGKWYKLPTSNPILCVDAMRYVLKKVGIKRVPENVTMEFSLTCKRGSKWLKVFAGEKGIQAKGKWMEMHFYLAEQLEKHNLMNKTFWVKISATK